MGTGTGRGLNFGHTQGSNSFYAGDMSFMKPNDNFILNINHRKDKDVNGFFDIIAHGSTNEIEVNNGGKYINLSFRDAARLIAHKPGYKNQNIRLLSCNTGKINSGFAQNLANKLHVAVCAPTDYLWCNKQGDYFVAGMKTDGSPDYSKKGRFRIFYPARRKKK